MQGWVRAGHAGGFLESCGGQRGQKHFAFLMEQEAVPVPGPTGTINTEMS